MSANILTHKRLTELLEYRPDTGEFFWKKQVGGKIKPNTKAGFIDKSDRYIRIGIDKKYFLAHRLAWFYVHEEWPSMIDHINRNRSDNRMQNLRCASYFVNNRNRTKNANNSTGVNGVSFHKGTKKYQAQICLKNKNKYLGLFETLELAKEARQFAEEFFWEAA